LEFEESVCADRFAAVYQLNWAILLNLLLEVFKM